jgi:hypothetical protein
MNEINEQKWFCEKCFSNGFVSFYDGADILEVIVKIKDDHNKLSNEKCTFDGEKIRIID